MASIVEMKAKVARGIEALNEAEVLVQQGAEKAQETVTTWQTVSDHPELSAAISSLTQALQSLEQFQAQKASAVIQAERYSVGLGG